MQKERFYPVRDAQDPNKVTLKPVSEEEYRALYREIWRIRKKEQEHGRCMCPKRDLWKCDADCALCQYHAPGDNLSLDQMEKESGNEAADLFTRDVADIVTDQEDMRRLIRRLSELMPEAIEVGQRRQAGLSERQSLEQLDLKRSTYRSQLKKVKEQLIAEFGDELRQFFE